MPEIRMGFHISVQTSELRTKIPIYARISLPPWKYKVILPFITVMYNPLHYIQHYAVNFLFFLLKHVLYLGFKFVTAALMKRPIFWDITVCSQLMFRSNMSPPSSRSNKPRNKPV
jgi:hypothetical protein